MERQLINIIKGVAIWEICINQLRIKISSKPCSFRKIFDALAKHKDEILPLDLQNFMAVHRIPISEREAEFLVSLYCQSQPKIFAQYSNTRTQYARKLTYQDFKKMFEPSHLNKLFQEGNRYVNISCQQEVVQLLHQQIVYYRKLQVLRKQFKKTFGTNITYVFSRISEGKETVRYEKQGYLTSLEKKFRELGYEFTLFQYEAFKRRCRTSSDEIDFESFYFQIITNQPMDFPTHRKEHKLDKAKREVEKEVKRLNIQIEQDYEISKDKETTYNQLFYPIRKVFNPHQKYDKNNYYYDRNYMTQLKDYKEGYVEPAKDFQFKYSESKKGTMLHDHFFSPFYQHLYQRDKLQKFFNKFGKKFAYKDQKQIHLEFPQYIQRQ